MRRGQGSGESECLVPTRPRKLLAHPKRLDWTSSSCTQIRRLQTSTLSGSHLAVTCGRQSESPEPTYLLNRKCSSLQLTQLFLMPEASAASAERGRRCRGVNSRSI